MLVPRRGSNYADCGLGHDWSYLLRNMFSPVCSNVWETWKPDLDGGYIRAAIMLSNHPEFPNLRDWIIHTKVSMDKLFNRIKYRIGERRVGRQGTDTKWSLVTERGSVKL